MLISLSVYILECDNLLLGIVNVQKLDNGSYESLNALDNVYILECDNLTFYWVS